MILVVTHIDSKTGISCTKAPCKNGPKLPKITGLKPLWSRTSKNPTPVPEIICHAPNGSYLDIEGVLEVFSDEHEPELLAQELQARELKEYKVKADPVRETRNILLTQTDIYVLPDFPLSEQKRQEWLTYRQALRDITNQEGFPDLVEWPQPPAKE